MPWAQKPLYESRVAFCLCRMYMKNKKTIVYIDGFNLFYRLLKGTNYKWLDLYALCEKSLPKDADIVAIKYYTARVSSKINPDSPKDQQAYLKALSSISCLSSYFGSFQVSEKISFLASPLEFHPKLTTQPKPIPRFARVVKTEEKGSDVNLGVHLVRDGFKGDFDQAAVLTNDTDLNEPIRIVAQELGLPVVLLTPVPKPAEGLRRLATNVRHIKPYIPASQFPDVVITKSGTANKPPTW